MFVTFAFTTVRLFETLPVSMGIGMGGEWELHLGINRIKVKHEISQGREWEWKRSHWNGREWVHESHSRTSLA